MRRLNGIDALMLYLDGGSAYNHTLKISVLDPSTDPDGWSFPKLRRMFEQRAHLLPEFRMRYLPTPLGLHHPIWVEDPEFDLDAHVRRVVCPAPGGMPEFCALVEQVYAHPLDRDRPLWQTWIVEGLEGGRVALVTLLHHAYTDGVGVLDMLGAFYNDTPDDAAVVPAPWAPQPLPSTTRRLRWALRDLPARLKLVGPTARAMRDRVRVEREFARSGEQRLPSAFDRSIEPGPFQTGLSRSRRFSCETIPLAEVREVSKAFGATINDVFMACVAGGVRHHLQLAGSPPREKMVATMPLAVTPPAERPQPGNYSSIDYVWLHAQIADPLERLRATSVAAEATKQHFAKTKDADIGAVVELLPERAISGFARLNARTKGRFDTFKNVVVSNVPGPRQPRYLGRWKVDSWFSTGQISHGATLNMTVWSYCDQFNLCVLADAVAVPDTWELVRGFRAALDELLVLARAQTTAVASAVPSPSPTTTG
jgi:WS/DGAT/MGAT family acyltransferase